MALKIIFVCVVFLLAFYAATLTLSLTTPLDQAPIACEATNTFPILCR